MERESVCGFIRSRPGKPRFTHQRPGQPGINTLRLILDDGAADHALATTAEDADNLFDWLSHSDEVYFDGGAEQVTFETKGVGR